VVFHEDDARLRVGNGAENFAVLHHIALSTLNHHPAKPSLNRKCFKAALNDSFLSELLVFLMHLPCNGDRANPPIFVTIDRLARQSSRIRRDF